MSNIYDINIPSDVLPVIGLSMTLATAVIGANPGIVFSLLQFQVCLLQSQSLECPSNVSEASIEPFFEDMVSFSIEDLQSKNVQS